MSVYLEAVAQAAERRATSEAEFRAALQRAAEHHSLRTIAAHCGLTHSGVAWIVKQKENDSVQRDIDANKNDAEWMA